MQVYDEVVRAFRPAWCTVRRNVAEGDGIGVNLSGHLHVVTERNDAAHRTRRPDSTCFVIDIAPTNQACHSDVSILVVSRPCTIRRLRTGELAGVRSAHAWIEVAVRRQSLLSSKRAVCSYLGVNHPRDNDAFGLRSVALCGRKKSGGCYVAERGKISIPSRVYRTLFLHSVSCLQTLSVLSSPRARRVSPSFLHKLGSSKLGTCECHA